MVVSIQMIYYMILQNFTKEKDQKIQREKAKKNAVESINVLYEGRKMVFNVSTSEIFPLQPTEVTGNPSRSACVAKVSDRWCLKI